MSRTAKPSPATSTQTGGQVTERERRFVEHFMATGNATTAAIAAGYSKHTASQLGYRLLRKVQIQRAIAERTQADPAVWDRERRQRFWTAVASGAARYESAALRDRLKASELLGRSQADFIDRHELDAGPSLVDLLAQSNSLESEESSRLERMRPAAVQDECQLQHGGKCASMHEHAARCADRRWLAGERSLSGDQWRTNSEREGKTGLLCRPRAARDAVADVASGEPVDEDDV
jgi:phage terminase small subunit